MTYYHRLGSFPHKRHTQFRQADGSLHHEEVMGIHGFAGIQSILYHLNPLELGQTRLRLAFNWGWPREEKTHWSCDT